MSKPMIRIHDLATDEVIDREMTNAEFAVYEANQAAKAIADAEAQAKAKKCSQNCSNMYHLDRNT